MENENLNGNGEAVLFFFCLSIESKLDRMRGEKGRTIIVSQRLNEFVFPVSLNSFFFSILKGERGRERERDFNPFVPHSPLILIRRVCVGYRRLDQS